MIVGFPAEDERAFARHARAVARGGDHEGARLPVLAAARARAPPARDTVPPAVKQERGARLRALSRAQPARAGGARSAREDVVLVDRPGRGYGDDYSPWLVDAPVGELVARARRRGHGGGDPGA